MFSLTTVWSVGTEFPESHIDGTDQTSFLHLVIHGCWYKITSHRLTPNVLLARLVLQDMQHISSHDISNTTHPSDVCSSPPEFSPVGAVTQGELLPGRSKLLLPLLEWRVHVLLHCLCNNRITESQNELEDGAGQTAEDNTLLRRFSNRHCLATGYFLSSLPLEIYFCWAKSGNRMNNFKCPCKKYFPIPFNAWLCIEILSPRASICSP